MREARSLLRFGRFTLPRFSAIQGVSEGEAWKHFLHHTGGDGDAKLLRGTR